MGRLFGTNGVRGVVNKDLTVEKFSKLAVAAGAFLGKNIVVGRDGRISSLMLRDAAVSGLLSIGCNIHDVGMLPTPALQYAVKKYDFNGGLMVTASHNPPEFNGLKVTAGDGVEVSRQGEEKIEDFFFNNIPNPCPWNLIGKVSKLEVLKIYERAVLSHVNRDTISKARLKVAIDPGNGVAILTAPTIIRDLGCKISTINADINGRFPGRESEPRPDNLNGLKALVEASGADVGVAFDGDGDRAIFVDEKGKIHWGDRSFALVACNYLARNPGETVATPVSSSRVVQDVVEAQGGKVIWTRVGSVVVSRTMVVEGIKLGGEENGGIMYGPHQPVRDGTMAMAIILDVMTQEKRPLSELFDELPQYSQMKDRIACPENLKLKALEALKDVVEAPRVETIDGLKLWYSDGSWILIRPSGTEPVFRIYAEARNSRRVANIVEKHKKLVEDVIKNLE